MLKGKLTDRTTQVRFLRFVVTGVLVLLLQVGGLAFLTQWWSRNPAFVVSYAFAVTVHYLVNRFWALRSSRPDVSRQAGEYVLTVLGSFLTSFLLFQLASGWLHLPPVWAVLLVNPITTLGVFLVLNFRVFRT
jgi:putative flippase GtrA